jgi:hypothetical protein
VEPVQERVHIGDPVPVEVEITNEGDEPVELLGMSLPWLFHHAAQFELVDSDRFHNRLTVLDPPEVPDAVIQPHTGISGQIELSSYLGTDTESINDVAGAYTVVGTLRAFAADPANASADPYQLIELTSEPFAIAIG